jgi:O-antigen ligase
MCLVHMSKAAFRFLWCFVFVLPWDAFIHLPVLGSIPHLVGVAASAVGILHVLGRRRIRPPSGFHVFAVLFVLWAGLSSLWSIDPEATRTRFMSYLQLAVLVWLIWEIAWSPERGTALLRAYVLGAAVAGVATVYNYVSGASFVYSSDLRFTALNGDPNEVGLTLALGLPMAWYLSLTQPHQRLAWTWQLYIPLAITAILLTASRGAFVAAMVALVIIPWTLGRVRLRTKATMYALTVGSLLLASRFVPDASLERIGSTRASVTAGYFGGRGPIWKAGLSLVQERPLTGVGAGAYGEAVEPTLHRERSAHETFLAILVEDGIVGLSLFLAMVAAATRPLRHSPPVQRRFWIVLLAALAVGSLSLAWDYRKQLWFVLGVLAAQVAQRPAQRAVSRAAAGFAP